MERSPSLSSNHGNVSIPNMERFPSLSSKHGNISIPVIIRWKTFHPYQTYDGNFSIPPNDRWHHRKNMSDFSNSIESRIKNQECHIVRDKSPRNQSINVVRILFSNFTFFIHCSLFIVISQCIWYCPLSALTHYLVTVVTIYSPIIIKSLSVSLDNNNQKQSRNQRSNWIKITLGDWPKISYLHVDSFVSVCNI